MNLFKQKSLILTKKSVKSNESTSQMTSEKLETILQAPQEISKILQVEVESMKITGAYLDGKKLDIPLWKIIHEILNWYTEEPHVKFIGDQNTKNRYLSIFVNDFESKQAMVNMTIIFLIIENKN